MILIIGLIIIGIILLVLEILVLPGMVAGIVGGLLLLFAIFQMYSEFGPTAGHITLVSTFILTFAAIYGSFKTGAWRRYGLKDTLEGKVNDVGAMEFHEGDEGLTLSALRPSGTILVNQKKVEAQTAGEMIDAGTKVVITKVMPNKVKVKIKVSEL